MKTILTVIFSKQRINEHKYKHQIHLRKSTHAVAAAWRRSPAENGIIAGADGGGAAHRRSRTGAQPAHAAAAQRRRKWHRVTSSHRRQEVTAAHAAHAGVTTLKQVTAFLISVVVVVGVLYKAIGDKRVGNEYTILAIRRVWRETRTTHGRRKPLRDLCFRAAILDTARRARIK